MRFNDYLDRENDARRLMEIFTLSCWDDIMNESEGSLESWLAKLGVSLEKERGLIHVITGGGAHIIALFKAMFKAWWTKSEEDKAALKELIYSTKITKADVFDVLERIDALTLHIISGPLYILSVVTGWRIVPNLETRKETSGIKTRIASAISQLKDVVQHMPKKIAKKFNSFLRGMENIACGDLGICEEEK